MPYKDKNKAKIHHQEYIKKHPEINRKAAEKYHQTEKYKTNSRKYWQTPRFKDLTKFSSLKRKYGLSREAYQALLESQNGVCAICKEKNGRGTEKLAVDHNHKTNKVRGLLCFKCNVSLGYLAEDVERMNKMIQYVQSHNL